MSIYWVLIPIIGVLLLVLVLAIAIDWNRINW